MAAPALPMDDRDGVIWLNGQLVPRPRAGGHDFHDGNSLSRW